jgi:hypothetical protein
MEARARQIQHRAMRRMLLWLGCVALGTLPASAQPLITITLFDLVDLGPEVREAMKRETSRIFLDAGVELEWVECEVADEARNLSECARPLGPTRLMLQLVPGVNKARPTASGLVVLQGGSGVFACLFPERVKELARDANWQFGDLLGHAAAHELGHLLLRSSAHTTAGVMRANWEIEDLRRLSHTGLVFLPGQLGTVQAPTRKQLQVLHSSSR